MKDSKLSNLKVIVTVFLVSVTGTFLVEYFSYANYINNKISHNNKKVKTGNQPSYTELCNVDSADFLDRLYPVGSIYVSTTLSSKDDVHDALGGTWEVYGDGRLLRGTTTSAEDTNNSTGTVTLTADNLPSHFHTISHTHGTPKTTITSSGAHTHSTTAKTTSVNGTTNNTLTAQGAGAHSHTVNVRYGGVSGYGLQLGTTYYTSHLVLGPQADSGTWATAASAGAHTHSVTGTITIPALSVGSTSAPTGAHTHTVPAMTTNSQSSTTSGAAGAASPTAFSTLDPYITVFIYKRIS